MFRALVAMLQDILLDAMLFLNYEQLFLCKTSSKSLLAVVEKFSDTLPLRNVKELAVS